MKNKFKKSKIIVPALALITATTVASVTGTVAWFTATRTVTATTNSFISTDVDSNLTLECTAVADSGTTIDSNDETKVSVQGKLTHGSYNAVAAATGNAYVANLGDDGVASGYRELGTVTDHVETKTVDQQSVTTNKWLAKADTNAPANQIWYAVAWTMEFSYENQQDGVTSYLLFDDNASTMTNSANGHTMPGFRIAFMNSADSKLLVIGGDSTTSHVKSETETDNFSSVTAIGETATTSTRLADNASGLANNSIGTFDANHKVTLTCVAWYEGTDPAVVSKLQNDENVAANVTSSLVFYSRNANA